MKVKHIIIKNQDLEFIIIIQIKIDMKDGRKMIYKMEVVH